MKITRIAYDPRRAHGEQNALSKSLSRHRNTISAYFAGGLQPSTHEAMTKVLADAGREDLVNVQIVIPRGVLEQIHPVIVDAVPQFSVNYVGAKGTEFVSSRDPVGRSLTRLEKRHAYIENTHSDCGSSVVVRGRARASAEKDKK